MKAAFLDSHQVPAEKQTAQQKQPRGQHNHSPSVNETASGKVDRRSSTG